MTVGNDAAINTSPGSQPGKIAAPPENPAGYELIDEIGHGGMGVVYRARDTALDRDVAVKLLFEHHPPDSIPAQRFLNEVRITGQLQHPGIPAVHQVGRLTDGRPFLVMKLIKGSTLEAILNLRTDPLADHSRLLAVFEAVCQAVGYAHAHRVIHRDLKPANVMVGAFGEVQVMDWGLAKVLGEENPAVPDTPAEPERGWTTQVNPTPVSGSHTQAGSMVGTPAFIPPEQAVGEIKRVNERSDVFGLGAILAMILTGKPPYVGETDEVVRVRAVRGKLKDCFARLDSSGAEPDLVALCKKCLAFEPADRPADAGALAQAVAAFRAAADERARRAELEEVRVKGEQATAAARSVERRKRHRLALWAAAVLTMVLVGGLAAVLAIQRRANANLAAKNIALADEQAKVQARFELAQKAIALFHTGVSEDMLLKNPEFKELRANLLKEAAAFYADLQKLLAGQTDSRSRKALADGYFQLAELTYKVGSWTEALALHRKALAIRRELAAASPTDVGTRLDVIRSLWKMGAVSGAMSDYAEALAAYHEGRDLAEWLEAEYPTDAVRFVLVLIYDRIGWEQRLTGKAADALEAHGKAMAIMQKLADANPANAEFQFQLAILHNNIGHDLRALGKSAEALAEHGQAMAIVRKLVEANPTHIQFQMHLAGSHNNIGLVQSQMGRPAEALAAQSEALAIRQSLVDAHPAVTEFQSDLGWCYDQIGILLLQMGKPAEALEAHGKTLAIMQKLAEANADNTEVQKDLACSHCYLGRVLARLERFPEAFTSLDAGLSLHQKLVDGDPENTNYRSTLACGHAYRGEARIRAGQSAGAAADLRRAVELWAKASALDTTHISAYDSRFELARAFALLAGLDKDAKSGVKTAEAATFADRAVSALRDAINAGGLNWQSELKDPDFDAIRGRADFQKLLAEKKN
jgi:tetratricopeptide (TPR) repeat protein